MGARWGRKIIKSAHRIVGIARCLGYDRNGASAIEFILIFPIMVLLLAGTVDLSQALLASRKLNQLTATIGDMVSQKSNWTSADLGSIMTGASTILEPFNRGDLAVQLAVVDVDNGLVARVNWSQAYNTTALKKGMQPPVPIPPSIAESGKQLIAVNATFSLTTPFSTLLEPITGVTNYRYSRSYIMRPRIKDSVVLKN